ncbi:MAG: L-seryl-tRNA(Sec) selenium transferase [Candidatus Cloacimonetes bacterium]|nr:L-seryl-tRNA(Sec) selenium transferase [Candidatus Cloacimonadota bacterium]
MNNQEYRNLPGVDKLLQSEEGSRLTAKYGLEIVTELLRQTIEQAREEIKQGKKAQTAAEIIAVSEQKLAEKMTGSLRAVINGSGIVLHTNLGRAPLGERVMADLQRVLTGYSNLEFDLSTGKRGQRNVHVSGILKEITGAEDAVVVNNNAAAVMLILKTLADGKEVIISRGEMIEIGGSFRIPDIMAASGAKMVEVGCTNRTKLADYREAITENTALIFKAHKSNYYIGGFCEEVELEELAALAHEHDLAMVYDIGSGLLRIPENLDLGAEPEVRSALQCGVDVICFSGDKLLGGPQAGIIAGRCEYITKIAKAPMMRALRVGKMTMAALISVMQAYLNENELKEKLPIFNMLSRSIDEKRGLAEKLTALLEEKGIHTKIIESFGRCGGGTMPELKIASLAVQIIFAEAEQAEVVQRGLLAAAIPVLGVLREGELIFDVTSLLPQDLAVIAEQLAGQMNIL